MIFIALSSLALSQTGDAHALSTRIESAYFDAPTGRFREELKKPDTAFNWTLGILISAQNSLAKIDPTTQKTLNATLEMADTYWNPKGPVGGFDVLPGPKHPNDRYYDDNEWMVMSLVESYEITKDKRWLLRAKDALKFVLSGESSDLGGGIFWREREKTSKNTCSNAPAAAACLAIYRHTREKKLLDKALSLYHWTKKNLQDPKDGLYFDSMKLDGKIDKKKWTYNSALMLRSAHQLYLATKSEQYKIDFDHLQSACLKKWVKADGTIDDELQFAHLLFENLDPSAFRASTCIERLRATASSEGFFPARWNSSAQPTSGKLLIQVSAMRALATYELWEMQGKLKTK